MTSKSEGNDFFFGGGWEPLKEEYKLEKFPTILVNAGADIPLVDKTGKNVPHHLLVQERDIIVKDNLKILLDANAPTNVKDNNNDLSVHLATGERKLYAVKEEEVRNKIIILNNLDRGFDVLTADKLSNGPLHGLIPELRYLSDHTNYRKKHRELVLSTFTRLVRDCKTDINSRNNAGSTPLLTYLTGPSGVVILDFLVSLGAEVMVCDNDGKNAAYVFLEHYSNVRFSKETDIAV
jgi:hypothetical protein